MSNDSTKPAIGHLIGDRVVLDSDVGFEFFKKHFYGNPIGIQKAKRIRYPKPYILDFFEAVYLCEKGVLKVVKNGKELSLEELKEIAEREIPHFLYKYHIYKDLREKGYVLRSGLKYGSEWLAYLYGPDVEHALFVIKVLDPNKKILGCDLVGTGRLAHSVRKRIALAFVRKDKNGKPIVRYYIFSWFKI